MDGYICHLKYVNLGMCDFLQLVCFPGLLGVPFSKGLWVWVRLLLGGCYWVMLGVFLSGELSRLIPERLPLVVGSALGALAFLVLAAITIFAFIFQR